MLKSAVDNVAHSRASSRVIGVVRIVLGCAAIIRAGEAYRVLSSLVCPDVLRLSWFEEAPEPTPTIVVAVTSIWLVTATAFTIGLWTRVSGALLGLVMVASIALEQQAYSNHLYLLIVMVLLFVLTEPGAALSVDARRKGTAPETVAGWPIFLMKLQISVVYVFAAVTKLNEPFLSGAVLFTVLGAGPVSFPEELKTGLILSVMATSAIAVEMILSVFLWRRRGRKIAVVLGLGLHIPITLFLPASVQLVVFSMIMLSSYGLFFAEVEDPLVAVDSAPGSDEAAMSATGAELRAAA